MGINGKSHCINSVGKIKFSDIEPVEKKEYYPLSSAQMRMFILYQFDKNKTSDNLPQVKLAEGAYLPIDLAYPDERNSYMLKDSAVKLLLTKCDMELSQIPGEIEVINLRHKDCYCGESGNPLYINKAADLLYVIYTSGSTGRPKGVMLEHRSLVNLLIYGFKFTNLDFSSILQFFTISFDVSFQEIFSALLSGGKLILIDYLIAYMVSDQPVDVSELRNRLSEVLPDYMIPSYFTLLENIPLNPNGKVDRKALPEPGKQSEVEYTAPGNEIEEKLLEIWSEVLAIEKKKISINGNFFLLGG